MQVNISHLFLETWCRRIFMRNAPQNLYAGSRELISAASQRRSAQSAGWQLDINITELRCESYAKAGYYVCPRLFVLLELADLCIGCLGAFLHRCIFDKPPVSVDLLATGSVYLVSHLAFWSWRVALPFWPSTERYICCSCISSPDSRLQKHRRARDTVSFHDWLL